MSRGGCPEAFDAIDILNIARAQERALGFKRFSREDALEIGCLIARMGQDSERPIAVRVYHRGVVAFQYVMEGREVSHLEWTQRKYETVMRTGASTMSARICVRCLDDPLMRDDETGRLTIGSGGFPIWVGSELVGAVCVSGLIEPRDHAIVVRAIGKHLGVEVPELPRLVEDGWLPFAEQGSVASKR